MADISFIRSGAFLSWRVLLLIFINVSKAKDFGIKRITVTILFFLPIKVRIKSYSISSAFQNLVYCIYKFGFVQKAKRLGRDFS